MDDTYHDDPNTHANRTKLTYRLNENLVKKKEGILEALTPDNGESAGALARARVCVLTN